MSESLVEWSCRKAAISLMGLCWPIKPATKSTLPPNWDWVVIRQKNTHSSHSQPQSLVQGNGHLVSNDQIEHAAHRFVLARKINMQQWAEQLALSSRTLSRLFLADTGLGFQ